MNTKLPQHISSDVMRRVDAAICKVIDQSKVGYILLAFDTETSGFSYIANIGRDGVPKILEETAKLLQTETPDEEDSWDTTEDA